EIPTSISSLAWVNMGLNDKAGTTGYWDGYTTLVSVQNGYNMEVVNSIINKDFTERIQVLTNDSSYFFEFFLSKIRGTWNEPTFQSIYVGPMLEREQSSHTLFLKSFYENGSNYYLFNFYSGILMTIIF
ncbi:TPA: hypothetical protein ACHVGM_002238, partial [Streptococcus suis]